METKQLVITPPTGYEIDVNASTLNCIKFKPITKKECYDDVADKLFTGQTYYADSYGQIHDYIPYSGNTRLRNNCTSKKQVDKLMAINMLLNVAKYLNASDFNPGDGKQIYYIAYNPQTSKLRIDGTWNSCAAPCYFATVDAAKKAIKILGEDLVKLALNPEY